MHQTFSYSCTLANLHEQLTKSSSSQPLKDLKRNEKNQAGLENPVGVISRRMTPVQLQYSARWVEGPSWLRRDRSTWPAGGPEERSAVAIPVQFKQPSEIFSTHSSLSMLIRKVARIRRFIHNCRHPEQRRYEHPTFAEYREVMLCLARLPQRESFPEEISALQRGNQIKPSSLHIKLAPILVGDVLYVGGRPSKAPISANLSHQPLSKLVIVDHRKKSFHAGQRIHISRVREKHWPKQFRRLANPVINESNPCLRRKPKFLDQLVADLLSERGTRAPPFLVLVKEDNLAPLNCLPGHVEEMHASSDGNIRVVIARTKGCMIRPSIRDNVSTSEEN